MIIFTHLWQVIKTMKLPISSKTVTKCFFMFLFVNIWIFHQVPIRGVKSLGGHFACLCRGVWFLWSKKKNKKFLFQKENGNTFKFLIIVLEKSLQKEQIAQITQYDPWSAGINLRSSQSDLTPRILTPLSLVFKSIC